MTDGPQLLGQYVETGSETAFRDLVSRYVDLVYSTAVRLVGGDTHLAEDVAQTVFVDLSRLARTLSREVMLGGWLHRHTVFVAGKTMRGEWRRQARERQAVEMNAHEDHSAENLASVAPILDEAINQLGSEDRTAILLRFFEQQDFRSVGAALGGNEDAARKRVDRALEKLHTSLRARGVALSATALATTLSAQAVTAAPAGLAASISSVALAGAATSGGMTLTVLKTMSMTKLKVAIVSALVVAGVTVPLVLNQQSKARLRAADEALRQQRDETSRLAAENERLAKLTRQAIASAPSSNDQSHEVLRLRGEVGKLRQQSVSEAAARSNAPSALSGLTANPEMWKLIRDQQKAGLGMIYKEFGKQAGLPKEQSDQLTELLADNVMENIDQITAVIREGKSSTQMEQLFADAEAALGEKVKALIGPEAYTEYQDYTRNLASSITAEQFKAMMSGEAADKAGKSKQLFQALQAEAQLALANAGLSPDYQLVPTLNFRNFASEAAAERNLQLLDSIYERVISRAGSFLSPDDLVKFGEFRTKAIGANRMALAVNRKLMSPGGP